MEDNNEAVRFYDNPFPTSNSMHIVVRHHHAVREHATSRMFEVVHLPSVEQHAGFPT